ncbi:hypothetical protein [Aromatoleum evansii]|uniref:hypothetical protein n=1 Tax=Aromatoleum evansii TaxID=59406 RepID=UPI00145C3E5B|nr:hypothetical protein [Aromatoleum evansii]NMG31759.1 hypothetical protein [Aromatoleum evansii]
MDELLSEQIESLLGTNYSIKGLNKNLLTLSGFLADATLPDNVAAQLERVSQLAILQDLFESLMQALNHATAPANKSRLEPSSDTEGGASRDLSRLLDQIEAVRTQIGACGPINYGELIAWIATRGRERNMLRQRSRR